MTYPSAFTETLAGFAGYGGDDWGQFAAELVAMAGHGDEAREWLENELADSHAKPDEWSKPIPPPKLMEGIVDALGLDKADTRRLAMAFTYGK